MQMDGQTRAGFLMARENFPEDLLFFNKRCRTTARDLHTARLAWRYLKQEDLPGMVQGKKQDFFYRGV